VTERLRLQARHRRILQALLREHLPDVEVWAYGSRVAGRSHAGSDLDLVLRGPDLQEIPAARLAGFEEALQESRIPFLVEAHDWARLPEHFHTEIKRRYVALRSGPQGTTDSRKPLSADWKPIKLGEIVSLTKGVSYRSAELSASDVALVTLKSFERGGGYRRDGLKPFIGGYRPEQVIEPGALVVALTDLTQAADVVGRPAVVSADHRYKRLVASLDVGILRPTSGRYHIDLGYVQYLLRSPEIARGVAAQATGTTVLHLRPNDLLSILVSLPPLPEQRAIARVLGALDAKIELNRRMSETLEAMARALFKSWFIDFDPVRAKMAGRATGLPKALADLFPNRLADSELGEIPEGWSARPLDSIAQFQNGLALQKFRPKANEARLPVVKIAQLRTGEASGGEWSSAAIKPECIIEDGDVVFSWSGSLLVRVWCGGRAALNQHLFKVTSNQYPKWFYLQCLLSHVSGFRRIARDKATTMGHIKRHHLNEALCVAPPRAVINAVSKTFASLLDRLIANDIESGGSAGARDALLPKLISGEIRLHDADKAMDALS